jgi:diguanylate cyclase (GGDEF)-like protein
MSSTAVALFLPAMMAICAATLLVLSRFNQPAAFAWGLGFGFCALGFAAPVLPLSENVVTLASDLFFVACFFCYAEAFLIHFAQPLYRRERTAFVAIYLIMNAYVVLQLKSPQLELLLNDIATACLLGFALISVVAHAKSLADRALVMIGSVMVIDILIRVLVFVYMADSSDQLRDFTQSAYAQFLQLTTMVIGLLYVIAIAAAIADRVIGQFRDAAERDPLTGLLNRRGYERLMSELKRDGSISGAVVACDIDHFKQVNDQFGHATGDRVLQVLALALRQGLPVNAISARFGGEEFVSFLPNIGLADAGVMAQSLRSEFAGQNWHLLGINRPITASFGVAVVAEGKESVRATADRADRALYEAKAAGRNKVIWDHGSHESGSVVVDIKQMKVKAAHDGA